MSHPVLMLLALASPLALTLGILGLSATAASRRLERIRRGEPAVLESRKASIVRRSKYGEWRTAGILLLTPTRLVFSAWGPAWLGWDVEISRADLRAPHLEAELLSFARDLCVTASGRTWRWRVGRPEAWTEHLSEATPA